MLSVKEEADYRLKTTYIPHTHYENTLQLYRIWLPYLIIVL